MFSLGMENLLSVKIGPGSIHAKYRGASPAAFSQVFKESGELARGTAGRNFLS